MKRGIHLMKTLTFLSSLLALLALACTSDTVGPHAEPILEGHFGVIEDFNGLPALNEAYTYGGQTYLDVRTRGEGWALMSALTLQGELGQGDLAPGSIVHASARDYYGWDDFPAVTMLGCAGPSDDEWWTDCAPDDIVVQFGEGSSPESVQLSFDATFPEDCGGTSGPPPAEPPPYPGEPVPSEPTDPVEPLPASSGGAQVIHGVIEVRLADIAEGVVGVDEAPVLAGASGGGNAP